MDIVIDLGEFVPTTTTAPMRDAGGMTILGRVTTTEEQRLEAIDFIVGKCQEHNEETARATIRWSNFDPTILEISTITEHLHGKRVHFADRVIEMLPNGAEIQPSEEARVRTLVEEVADLHEKGML